MTLGRCRARRESGNTVTIRTSAAHGRSVGDIVTIAGVGRRRLQRHVRRSPPCRRRARSSTRAADRPASPTRAAARRRTSRRSSVRIGGNDSAVVGGSAQRTTNAEHDQAAINAIPGFAGTATVTGAASTGFTVTYTGAAAGLDVRTSAIVEPQLRRLLRLGRGDEPRRRDRLVHAELQRQRCPAPIVNGTNYTAAGILAALTPLLPAGGTRHASPASAAARVQQHRASRSRTPAALAGDELPGPARRARTSRAGASGFAGELDKGGAVDNKGTVTTTGQHSSHGDRAARTTRSRCGRRSRSPAAPTDADGDRRCSTAGSRTTAAAPPARRC